MPHPSVSARDDLDAGTANPPSSGNALKILAVLAICFLMICGGGIGLAYLSMRSLFRSRIVAEIADREHVFVEDAISVNQSLEQFQPVKQQDAQIRRSLMKWWDASAGGEVPPFHHAMFSEAVRKSPQSPNGLSLLGELQLREALKTYVPSPYHLQYYMTIHRIERDRERNLAHADLVVYDYNDAPIVVRWFLVYDPDYRSLSGSEGESTTDWYVYDYCELDQGFRMSDEYAVYFESDFEIRDRYDAMTDRVYDISSRWNDDNGDKMVRLLRRCETAKMNPFYQSALLQLIASVYRDHGKPSEALRALGAINNPDDCWGVWSLVAQCHHDLGNHEKAIDALARAEKLSAHHPRVAFLKSTLFQAVPGRDDEAVDASARAMVTTPKNSVLFYHVINNGKPSHARAIVDALLQFDPEDEEGLWNEVINHGGQNPELIEAVANEVNSRNSLPAGYECLLDSVAAQARDQSAVASEQLLRCLETSTVELWKSLARERLIRVRIAERQFEKLFSEQPNLEATLEFLLEQQLYEGWFDQPAELISAVETSSNKFSESEYLMALAAGLQGSLECQLGRDREAVGRLGQFLSWASNKTDSEIDQDNEPGGFQSWWSDTVRDELITALMRTEQFGEAMELANQYPHLCPRMSDYVMHRGQSTQRQQLIDLVGTQPRSDAMRVFLLSLQATEAAYAEDQTNCVAKSLEAIQLSRKITDSDEEYWNDSLIDKTAQWFLRLGVQPSVLHHKTAPDLNQEDSLDLHRLMVRRCCEILHEPLADAWFASATQAFEDESESLAPIVDTWAAYQREIGALEESEKRLTQMIDRLDALDEQASSNVGSWLEFLRTTRLQIWLETKQFDLAAESLAQTETTGMDPTALVELVNKDWDSLREKLSKHSADQIGEWIRSKAVERFAKEWADEPSFRECIRDVPLIIARDRSSESVRLLIDGSATKENLIDWIKTAFQDAAQSVLGTGIETFELKHPDSDRYQWTLRGEHGDFVAIVAETEVFERHALHGLPIAKSFTDPSQDTVKWTVVSIEILDQRPMATARLFKTMANLEDWPSGLVAVSWPEGQLSWFGESIKTLATWNGTIKMHDASRCTLYGKSTNQPGGRQLTLDEWKQRLDQSAGETEATMTINRGSAEEHIRVHVKNVDDELSQLIVQLKEDSQLDDLLKRGSLGRADVYRLSLPDNAATSE